MVPATEVAVAGPAITFIASSWPTVLRDIVYDDRHASAARIIIRELLLQKLLIINLRVIY